MMPVHYIKQRYGRIKTEIERRLKAQRQHIHGTINAAGFDFVETSHYSTGELQAQLHLLEDILEIEYEPIGHRVGVLSIKNPADSDEYKGLYSSKKEN